jgi:hypothetical protein
MPSRGERRLARSGFVVAVAALTACHVYNPVDEIQYRSFDDTRTAVRAILDDLPATTRVYAVGEYHPTRSQVERGSPLARFTTEIIGLLEPRARHLVVEAWLEDACRADGVQAQLAAALRRSAAVRSDVDQLREETARRQIATHDLPITCIEHASMLDARGRVDFLRLLMLVTEKLHDTTRALVTTGHEVIVYGGALHNDLYPRYALEELSYAQTLAKELGGGVVEVDLVVPEIVAPMMMVRQEPWFPLLGLASPGRVIVWRRGANSYVVILPAQSEAVAQVALPPA